jgi:ribonuclease HI
MEENSLQHSQLPHSNSDRNPQEQRSETRSRASKHRPRDRRPVHAVLRRRLERQPRTWRQWRCHRQNQLPDAQCRSVAISSAHPSTTNNQAEYVGVLAGLRAAHANNWTPLEVVGDSQLILGQLKNYRAPRNDRLHQLYAEARRLGDLLGVRRWNHHLRSFNKMADAAANAAMDTETSSQAHHPTTQVQLAEIATSVNLKPDQKWDWTQYLPRWNSAI